MMRNNKHQLQSGSTDRKSLGGGSIEERMRSIEEESPKGAYTSREMMASSVKQLQRVSSRKSVTSLASLRQLSIGANQGPADFTGSESTELKSHNPLKQKINPYKTEDRRFKIEKSTINFTP